MSGMRSRFRKVFSSWNLLKSSSTESTRPTSFLDLQYTDATGIMNLRATTQFSKSGGGGGSPSYSTGFSPVLHTVYGTQDPNAQWLTHSVDISAYAGATVRPVFHYVSGSGFTGDLQLDQINIDGTTYGFESGVDSFERNQSGTYASYGSVAWQAVTTATSGNGLWLRDSGGTASNGTGLTTAASGSWYLYAETSGGGYPNTNFWLRGPQVTLGSSPTFSYYEARSGRDIGTLNVHLDVIA